MTGEKRDSQEGGEDNKERKKGRMWDMNVRYEWYHKEKGTGKEVAVGVVKQPKYVWKPLCTPT